jgi:hypothetical protein
MGDKEEFMKSKAFVLCAWMFCLFFFCGCFGLLYSVFQALSFLAFKVKKRPHKGWGAVLPGHPI